MLLRSKMATPAAKNDVNNISDKLDKISKSLVETRGSRGFGKLDVTSNKINRKSFLTLRVILEKCKQTF